MRETSAHIEVPLVDLTRQYRSIRREIHAALDAVCASADCILGDELARFEYEFAASTGTKHAVGVGSGTGALLIALKACGIGPGDEVLVPANTFISTVLAITHAGAAPVLVDVEPESQLVDPEALERKITRRTRAILPVHLFGQTADMGPISKLAKSRGLWVIEDACQAHGALYRGRPAGSIGDIAAFSFYPAKNLGAYGDGGAITTNSPRLAQHVSDLRNVGQRRKNVHRVLGYNDRLDTLQAAFLRVKLTRLAEWNAKRRAAAALYRKLLADTPLSLPVEIEGNTHVYHLFVVRAPRRNQLAAFLRDRGIATGRHYPVPVHRQPCYRALGLPRGSFPHTEAAAREILSLPLFPELTRREIRSVCNAIRDFYQQSWSTVRPTRRAP